MMSNNLATKEQITALHAALHRKQLLKYKADMVAGVSDGRTTHSTELTVEECRLLIADLNKDATTEDKSKKMRGNIVAMAHELGWITKQTVAKGDRLVTQDDYTRLDAWMTKNSYLKKKLFDYRYEQLPKLVYQFKQVYLAMLKK